ncbi:MAG: hypothetical protein EPN74_14850 [Rhodanobacter sp.]|nr:MAG: hypothetical protein EPN74_14850 [Rhodanobacter sp.]
MALGLVLLAVFGAAGWACFAHTTSWWVGSAVIDGVCAAMLWKFVLSYMLLPAIDAHQLRLPGMQRSLFVGWAFYGLLCVLLPAFGLGLWAGKVAVIAVIMAMFCLAGLLLALLPRYVDILIWAPFYAAAIHPHSVLGLSLGHSNFLAWALPLALLLLVLALARIHGLVVTSKPYAPSRNAPSVLGLGRAIAGAFAAGGGLYGSRAIAGRADWMQARASLRGCGQGRPVVSLRLALGGIFMPTNFMGWLRKHMVMLAAVLAVGGFMVWRALGDTHDLSPISGRHNEQLLVLSMLTGFASASMTFHCLMGLLQRWRNPNAELSLLALLPGLGRAGADVKRNLLLAILLPPLRIQLSLLAALMVLALGLHAALSTDVFVMLSQLSLAAAVVAYALLITGGQVAGRWLNLGISLLWPLLIMLPLFVSGRDRHLGNLAVSHLTLLFDAGWVLLIVLLLWLGRRGWRGLQQRPHPFLPR